GPGKAKKAAPAASKPAAKAAVRECSSCGAKLRPGKELCGQCGTRNPEPEIIEELLAGSDLGSPAWTEGFLRVFSAPAKAFQQPLVKIALPVLVLGWLALFFFWPTAAVFTLL